MAIEFKCQSCQQDVTTPDEAAGKKGKCPHCGEVMRIPELSRSSPLNSPQAAAPSKPAATPAASSGGIEFSCPQCGNVVNTPASAAGKKGKCPHCGVVMSIPMASQRGAAKAAGASGIRSAGKPQAKLPVAKPLASSPPRTILQPPGAAQPVGGLTPLNNLTPLESLTPLGGLTPLVGLTPLTPAPAPSMNPFAAHPGGVPGLTPLGPAPPNPFAAAPYGAPPSPYGAGGASPLGGAASNLFDDLPAMAPLNPYAATTLPPAPSNDMSRPRPRRGGQVSDATVMIPAILQALAALPMLFLQLVRILFSIVILSSNNPQLQNVGALGVGPIGEILMGVVLLALVGTIVWGSVEMARWNNYSLAFTAAVLSTIGCSCLGFPFGIWSLVVLSQQDVKRQFSS